MLECQKFGNYQEFAIGQLRKSTFSSLKLAKGNNHENFQANARKSNQSLISFNYDLFIQNELLAKKDVLSSKVSFFSKTWG